MDSIKIRNLWSYPSLVHLFFVLRVISVIVLAVTLINFFSMPTTKSPYKLERFYLANLSSLICCLRIESRAYLRGKYFSSCCKEKGFTSFKLVANVKKLFFFATDTALEFLSPSNILSLV